MKNFLLILLMVGLSGTAVWGAGGPDVKVQLSAHRVTRDAQNKEMLSSGASAKPGEIIEYRATYKNSGSATAGRLQGTLPVPDDMEFVSGSAVPAGAYASTDGKNYAPIPLTRMVKLANGTTARRDVPLAEYRSLRWNLADLAPGASVTVTARMKIKDNQKGPVIIQLDSVKKSDIKETGGKK